LARTHQFSHFDQRFVEDFTQRNVLTIFQHANESRESSMAGPRNPAAAWSNAKILLTGHGAHRRLLLRTRRAIHFSSFEA
jgi:hypothetical protein